MSKSLLKKVTAILLLLLLISGLTACKSKSEINTATPTAKPTATITVAPTAILTATPTATLTVTPTAAITAVPTATITPAASISVTPQVSPTTIVSDGEARVTIDGTKFIVDGKELWINGVNTPWDRWNDFGSSSFNEVFWEEHFAKLEEAGVNASRIWINCNGMVGVILNADGSFKEVTEKHWKDLDKLFSIAEKHHIYIMATLLSFDHFKESNTAYQNWRSMITSSDNIDSFVNGYVIPFVKRYDSCDYLWSIDLVNEPDWIFENAECGKIGWENISDYFARACAGIHENSDVLVTVGMGMIKYNSDKCNGNFVSDDYLRNLTGNDDSYLDFYSTHYYFWQNPWYGFPFEESPTDFKLDGTKPSVIGEVGSLDDSGRTIAQKYESAYNNGWNGVMAWTSNGVDSNGGFKDVEPAAKRMLELIPDLIRPLK